MAEGAYLYMAEKSYGFHGQAGVRQEASRGNIASMALPPVADFLQLI